MPTPKRPILTAQSNELVKFCSSHRITPLCKLRAICSAFPRKQNPANLPSLFDCLVQGASQLG